MNFLRELVSRLDQLPAFVEWAGYVGTSLTLFAETGLLIGVLLPGDSLLIAAGVLASHGFFDVWLLGWMLTLAASAGNHTAYWLGRTTGPRIFARDDSRVFKRRHAMRAEAFFARYGATAVIVGRFVPFVRTFLPIVAGVGRMHYRTFIIVDIIGSILWVWLLLLVSYYLAKTIPDIEHQLGAIILAVVAVSLVPPAWMWWSERRAPKAGAAGQRSPQASD